MSSQLSSPSDAVSDELVLRLPLYKLFGIARVSSERRREVTQRQYERWVYKLGIDYKIRDLLARTNPNWNHYYRGSGE